MLQIVDAQWKDHLYSLDHLKEGIGLRGYGQRDPLVEYKKESFALFTAMRDRVDEEMIRYLWRLRPVLQEETAPAIRAPARRASPLIFNDPSQQASPFAASPGAEGWAERPVLVRQRQEVQKVPWSERIEADGNTD
jgi:preprotein translocase subunit SecA